MPPEPSARRPKCGLCGSTEDLVRTPCCGHWACRPEFEKGHPSWVVGDSCADLHRRGTLCGHHHSERHPGDWRNCSRCRRDLEGMTELYVWWGTNEWNFEPLEHPPEIMETRCSVCHRKATLPKPDKPGPRREFVCPT